MNAWERTTLALRAAMEIAVVGGLAYWGFRTGRTALGRALLGIGVPVVGFGLWGAVDFHQIGRIAEPLRLFQELAISGLAALALYAAGQHGLGLGLATISVVHHMLVYALGNRLLKRPADSASPPADPPGSDDS